MLGFLNRYLRPRWPHALLLAALVLGNEGLNLLIPQVIRSFIDVAQAGGALESLLTAGALFMGIALLNQALGICENTVAANLGWLATNDLRADLTAHVLRLDMPFHNTHTPGELIERVDGDVGTLRNFFSRFVVLLLGGVLFLFGVLFMLWREDWRIALFTAVTSAVALALLVWGRLIGVRYSIATRQASADVTGFLEERLSGLADIRGNALQRHTVGRMEALILKWLDRVRAMLLVGIGIGVVTTVVRITTMALTLGGVAWLFGTGAISLGTAYLLVHYAQEAQSTVRQISRQLEDLQRATASLTRIRELEAEHPLIVDAGTSVPLPEAPSSVTFEDVSFAYGDGLVVRDVSFSLAPGRTLGLLGRTGSGKSTLARLLFRLYDPTAGRILLGGTDLRDLSLSDLHLRVALVTQEVQLFHAPLRDNVALFDRSILDERILRALDEVELGEWACSLPRGLDTLLATGLGGLLAGTGLSAGEAQLLALARAFLRAPSLVVLDEPSSRLDPQTEARLEHAVDRLLSGRTAIVIAHRLRTLERADDVLLLEGGRVLEHGPRAALAADPASHFARLLRAGGDLDARAATAESLVLA